ncbi:chloride channel protein [Flavisolibacter ginsenosidimutans]|uniref:Chloride channel protein n=1 Tax=Flavisolibacter ginsenosidimutans TaxID=661481 RepID=A0A5B8UPZ8_9BACT|nr:chloride channel protein [Flavisolibacter ginsenosidimutans]QEC58025.1 chloride channel protein [Flavisolibacter ginsenosidimutans]
MLKKDQATPGGIPISVSLEENFAPTLNEAKNHSDKKRLLYISMLAVGIAAVISGVAKLLVYLINLCTNLSFHHQFSFAASSPATNNYGLWVIVVPVIGGVIVGLMALYGSKAIRGHGIPEAMEQILTNKSKIKPAITFLKPISAAISIGTGGPFGAEGPIIATGGAFGSTVGQLLKISHYERKILLAAGATAGMAAIFGSPIAAIFLAIELLLFEFSPRSILPVALACITGAAGHHFFFEAGPVFPMPAVAVPGNEALAVYSVIGIIIGFLSALITKIVYFIEDAFEKLPVHWMWWPAIGGLGVGIVGYFAPRTLGVGYENITAILSGQMTLQVILALCLLKFISWAIALGSGTSGGTLAPLLTIGGAAGSLLGMAAISLFPHAGVVLPIAAMIGMSAMFAGASRALLTSIVFAIESTGQVNALLPLLAACIAAYFISYFLMENTIMTEKIARRGVQTPYSYEPDILDRLTVEQVINEHDFVLSADSTVAEVRAWLQANKKAQRSYYVVATAGGIFQGVISASNLLSTHHATDQPISRLIKRKPVTVTGDDRLKTAVELMAKENIDVLPVTAPQTKEIVGLVSYKDILGAYKHRIEEYEEMSTHISLKRRTLKILLHGKRQLTTLRHKEEA